MAIQCSYYMEDVETRELPRRFLEAFSTILSHSNYAPFVDAAARMKLRCSRCAVSCPVYQASGGHRDIPCDRSELLLKVYRRYFTVGGNLRLRTRTLPSTIQLEVSRGDFAAALAPGILLLVLACGAAMLTHWLSREARA